MYVQHAKRLIFILGVSLLSHSLWGATPNPCTNGSPKWTLTGYLSAGYGPFTCPIGYSGDPAGCYGTADGFQTPGTVIVGYNPPAQNGAWYVRQHFIPNNND